MTERDTKFLGFAKLLQGDLMDAQVEHYHDENREDFITTLIANRAYDLVEHAIAYTERFGNIEMNTINDSVNAIPDLTQWPDSSTE